jgi:hypothetical protein
MRDPPARAHDQIRQLILRLAFRLFQRLRVAVHRRPERGMSQEFLHNLRVHTQRLDQSRERVPESVPANVDFTMKFSN